jgi:hypothetical protein
LKGSLNRAGFIRKKLHLDFIPHIGLFNWIFELEISDEAMQDACEIMLMNSLDEVF